MLYVGLVQSLLSAIVFGSRKPRHLSNRILSLWFLIFSLFFLGLLMPQGLVTYIKIGFVPFFLLSGPIFYFYVRSLIAVDFGFHWRDLVHLIPFVVLSIVRTIFFPESLDAASFSLEAQQSWTITLLLVLVSSIIGYWIATLVLLLHHQKNILNFFSNKSEKRSLNWVLLLMLVALISQVLFFSAVWIEPYFPSPQSMSFWLHQFNMAILGYLLLIFGLLQPIIFEGETQEQVEQEDQTAPEKYARSGLKPEQLELHIQEIIRYLEQKKPYTNPEYSLPIMVRDLNIPQQNLSQIINEGFGKNFYQLINEYRVREFQQLLQTPLAQQYTILSLAYEAGFNSKSSFNRVYREITGQTPSQYQRENLQK